jgi:hypothetical protein
MQMTITVEIDEPSFDEYLKDFPNKSRTELMGEVGNILYLNCSAIDSMLERAFEISSTSWVESEPIAEWQYGDHAPTTKDFPIELIEHQAKMHDLPCSDTLIQFAKACWTECAIKHNIKTGK